jgi:hypothetical protein
VAPFAGNVWDKEKATWRIALVAAGFCLEETVTRQHHLMMG